MSNFFDWSDVEQRGDDTRLTILGVLLFAIMGAMALCWLCAETPAPEWHGPYYGSHDPMAWRP